MYEELPSIEQLYDDFGNANYILGVIDPISSPYELIHAILEEDGETFYDQLDIFWLKHYGTKYHSGRYPYGSGENPYQHDARWLGRVRELRKQGFTFTDEKGKTYTGDTAIAKSMGMTSTEFRDKYKYEKNLESRYRYDMAKSLSEDGKGPTEIGRIMGINESTVRSILDEDRANRARTGAATAEKLKERIAETGKFIDVGTGVAKELGISESQLKEALYSLQQEGYNVFGGRFEQVTNPGMNTTYKVVGAPGTEHKEIFETGAIDSVTDYISRDGGLTYEKKWEYPASLDSSRLQINYANDDGTGGKLADGTIELRRGVDDLSLGNSHYSQVRILVDGKYYLKGMAVYSDDLPDGVDVRFNTNKTSDTPINKVLKEIKSDPDNPFGSTIKDSEQGGQYHYTDSVTGETKLGLINKARDEGDWSNWSNRLPSQYLSKQPMKQVNSQLNMAIKDKQMELSDIEAINNPTVKKSLLNSFAESCDSDSVHLYAASLPGQQYHVILPINSQKDTEIYAPNYENGTKVACVRFPHGGTFEIPILTVNNNNKEAKKSIGENATDAVGITSKVAERLSGADFDGDTVMCIPIIGNTSVKSTPALKELEKFDPHVEYAGYDGMKVLSKSATQTEMGKITNLIMDMTIEGAPEEDLAKAVKHSMVVIDANKHELDYQRSYVENGIAALKERYQGKVDEDGKLHTGAATIVTRAKNEYDVPKRQGTPKVNLEGTADYDPTRPEGALIYKKADDADYEVTKTNKKTGETTTITKTKTQKSTQMAETDDAYTLVSEYNTPVERAYAAYANKLKTMANEARKEAATTGKIEYSKEAAKTYAIEVKELNDALTLSESNKPRERQAQAIARSRIAAKVDSNPELKNDKEQYKKVKTQELTKARDLVGAKRNTINITDNQWKAIQSGAISESKLNRILNYADQDRVRELATPKSNKGLSTSKISYIKSLANKGYTQAQIASKLGISTSTVSKYINS